ncbi:glycosyltransferase family 2 protein [Spirochaetota bacterium]
MSLSFVILTWNSINDINDCIESILAKCREWDSPFSIYIVDNGSTDGTVELLNEFEKKYPEINCTYLQKNTGTTYSRNVALKKINSDYICILDSDTILSKGSIKDILEYLANHGDIGIAAPKIVFEDGSIQNSVKKFPTLLEKIGKLFSIFGFIKYNTNDFYSDFPFETIKEVDTAISACWFIPGTILKEIGYLDENILYAPEDVDFSIRVWKANKKIVYYPDFEIIHKTKQISHSSPFSKLSRSHLTGLFYYFRKHKYWFSRKKVYTRLGK